MTENITVVPTVKAYPAVLSKLEEAVCVAGFRIGLLQQPEWVRLFPIPFRELESDQQFRKWQEIEVDVDRTASDTRPESLKPQNNTIRAGRELKPAERRQLVDSMPHVTMCGLRDSRRNSELHLVWSGRGASSPSRSKAGSPRMSQLNSNA